MKRSLEKSAWIGLALVAAASACAGLLNGLQPVDFQWLPAKILASGENPYLYSLHNLPYMGSQLDAAYAPSCLALLTPFVFLSRGAANVTWAVCNLAFTAAFFLFVWKLWFENRLGGRAFALVVFVTLVGVPWRVLIGCGQHLMFSLAFFMATLYAAERGRKCLSGVLLALSLFKYTTMAPLCFVFLFRREWRAIVICAAIHILLTLGAGLYLGENPVMLVLQSLEVGGSLVAQGDADIASLLREFGWGGVKVWSTVGYVIYGTFCLVVAFARKQDDLLKFATLAVISNVMFYHRAYDFVTLVFPLIVALRDWQLRDGVSRYVRYLTFANVLWTFFILRAVVALHLPCPFVAIAFALEHLLLGALLSSLFSSYRLPQMAKINHR